MVRLYGPMTLDLIKEHNVSWCYLILAYYITRCALCKCVFCMKILYELLTCIRDPLYKWSESDRDVNQRYEPTTNDNA